MKIKNRGYVLPVAIGVIVLFSLGLLMFSSWTEPQKTDLPVDTLSDTQSTANDDATLDSDSVALDAQIKALEDSDADITSSLNDTSSI